MFNENDMWTCKILADMDMVENEKTKKVLTAKIIEELTEEIQRIIPYYYYMNRTIIIFKRKKYPTSAYHTFQIVYFPMEYEADLLSKRRKFDPELEEIIWSKSVDFEHRYLIELFDSTMEK